MATEGGFYVDITCIANADLSAGQHKIVVMNTSGKVALAAASTAPLFGVLQDKPGAADYACEVRVLGTSKVVAGGTINPGVLVMADANGDAIVATTAKYAIGIHVGSAAAADNDVIPVLIIPQYTV